MKFLVTGGSGQLGMELVRLLKERNMDFVTFNSKELDITDRNQVLDVFLKERPDVIFDAAAYTDVDKAEEEEGRDRNWLVNATGTKNLAEIANEINATMVFVSTDYVFDGKKTTPYLETDEPNPQNEYGRAKLAGEEAVAKSGVDSYIIRTSWVFGEFGSNFVFTMRNLGSKMDRLTVVNDQKGRPTWTKTLAEFMIYLVQNEAEYGIYNLSNDNEATWFDFAKEILQDVNVNVSPVTSEAFPTKAVRPQHSVLDLKKAKNTGFVIETWQVALKNFLATL